LVVKTAKGMNKEYIKEKVDFYKEILKILSAFLVASIGGTISLLFRKGNELAHWLGIVGTWISLTLILMIIGLMVKIELLLRELKNE